jgi:hypothetical protein
VNEFNLVRDRLFFIDQRLGDQVFYDVTIENDSFKEIRQVDASGAAIFFKNYPATLMCFNRQGNQKDILPGVHEMGKGLSPEDVILKLEEYGVCAGAYAAMPEKPQYPDGGQEVTVHHSRYCFMAKGTRASWALLLVILYALLAGFVVVVKEIYQFVFKGRRYFTGIS